MYDWMQMLAKEAILREQHAHLLHQAMQERLHKQSRRTNSLPESNHRHILATLGRYLIEFGFRLEERYGDMHTANLVPPILDDFKRLY
jgi:hypothetical protein